MSGTRPRSLPRSAGTGQRPDAIRCCFTTRIIARFPPRTNSGTSLIEDYDGVLAFGEALRDVYLREGWADRVFTWHEAADTALFRPLPARPKRTSLIWIGNWGDGERAAELNEFLIEPVARLHLPTRIHGVRFPRNVCRQLAMHNIHYAGWLPNHHAPAAFARARMTVHVPRRQYVEALPGIPTIRVFEALASGIPLICAPWRDEEQLFPADAYLSVRDGEEMTNAMAAVAKDEELRAALISTGLFAIRERHSCAHRVRELLDIVASLRRPAVPDLPHAAQATERVA
jgi:spore maturation protein CgeB